MQSSTQYSPDAQPAPYIDGTGRRLLVKFIDFREAETHHRLATTTNLDDIERLTAIDPQFTIQKYVASLATRSDPGLHAMAQQLRTHLGLPADVPKSAEDSARFIMETVLNGQVHAPYRSILPSKNPASASPKTINENLVAICRNMPFVQWIRAARGLESVPVQELILEANSLHNRLDRISVDHADWQEAQTVRYPIARWIIDPRLGDKLPDVLTYMFAPIHRILDWRCREFLAPASRFHGDYTSRVFLRFDILERRHRRLCDDNSVTWEELDRDYSLLNMCERGPIDHYAQARSEQMLAELRTVSEDDFAMWKLPDAHETARHAFDDCQDIVALQPGLVGPLLGLAQVCFFLFLLFFLGFVSATLPCLFLLFFILSPSFTTCHPVTLTPLLFILLLMYTHFIALPTQRTNTNKPPSTGIRLPTQPPRRHDCPARHRQRPARVPSSLSPSHHPGRIPQARRTLPQRRHPVSAQGQARPRNHCERLAHLPRLGQLRYSWPPRKGRWSRCSEPHHCWRERAELRLRPFLFEVFEATQEWLFLLLQYYVGSRRLGALLSVVAGRVPGLYVLSSVAGQRSLL